MEDQTKRVIKDLIPNSVHIAEITKGRLYLATVRHGIGLNLRSKSNSSITFFSIDDQLVYEGFDSDFGPLNLALLYLYCQKLNKLLKNNKKKIVHYTTTDSKKRANAAYLIGAFAVIYLKISPEDAYKRLMESNGPHLLPFRDAAFGPCSYHLYLVDCLRAVAKALKYKFLEFEKFDIEEYQYYEKVENGDLNWIVPNKFIAFCGPHSKSVVENGYALHSPETYFDYFRKHSVTTIVRLNKKLYDANRFIDNGFEHRDLFFIDGSTPSDAIMREFLEISENTTGAVAVHCKAGLGRTGTLIACYIMKHYRFTAAEAIAWIRICRPGSIIGYQQHWLQEKETYLWLQGDIHRNRNSNRIENINNNNNNDIINKNLGERSLVKCHILDNDNNTINLIANEVNDLDLNDEITKSEANERGRKSRKSATNLNVSSSQLEDIETQGDQLNRIKALRRNVRSATTTVTPTTVAITVDDQRSHRRSTSQPKEDVYISPFKGLKPQTKSTTVSIYNTRSAIRKIKTPDVEDEDKPFSETTLSSVKYIRKQINNNNNKSSLPQNSKTGVWRHVVVPVQEMIFQSSSSSSFVSLSSNCRQNLIETQSKSSSNSINDTEYRYLRRIRTRSNSPLSHKISFKQNANNINLINNNNNKNIINSNINTKNSSSELSTHTNTNLNLLSNLNLMTKTSGLRSVSATKLVR